MGDGDVKDAAGYDSSPLFFPYPYSLLPPTRAGAGI